MLLKVTANLSISVSMVPGTPMYSHRAFSKRGRQEEETVEESAKT